MTAVAAALSVLGGFCATAAVGSSCRVAREVVADRIWNGAPVDFAGVFRGGFIYLGYYDAGRRLVAARYDPQGRLVEKSALEAFFGGWDAHNGIEIEVDGDGYVHLAGNMHASPLVYFRSTTPHSVATSGAAEHDGRTRRGQTHLSAVHPPGDELLFTYRSGGSGGGRWVLDAFDDGQWRRLGVTFADRDSTGPVSAYPTRYVEDGTGFYTVAYVWRRGPDAALNYNLCFARSNDLTNWYSLGGAPMQLPLGPDCKDPIAAPGPDRGLGNTPVLLSDGRGTPIVLYSMLDERRHNQVYLAIGADGAWRISTLTGWTAHYDYRGTGSLRVPFAIAGFEDHNRNRIVMSIRHDLFGRSDFALDLSSWAVTKLRGGSGSGAPESDGKATLLLSRALPIRDEGGRRRAVLNWSTLPPNNDRAPACAECEPHVSDLVLRILSCEEKQGKAP